MSPQPLPASVEAVQAAARRIHPRHSLFLSYAPETGGAAWELHPAKRWLVLRSPDLDPVLDTFACALLATTAWLGRGAVESVPEALLARHRQQRQALIAVLGDLPPGETKLTRERAGGG